jgi:FMN phosphatase YigB (HAD superfamily)
MNKKVIMFDLYRTIARPPDWNLFDLPFLIKHKMARFPLMYLSMSLGIDFIKLRHFCLTSNFDSLEMMFDSLQLYFSISRYSESIFREFKNFLNLEHSKTLMYAGMEKLLIDLKSAGLKIILVSNICYFDKPIVNLLNSKEIFDYQSLSCETGIIKPDPLAFLNPLKKLSISPSEAIMIVMISILIFYQQKT